MSGSNDRQIGGSHYQTHDKVPQVWDIVWLHGLDFFQGSILKYVMRHKGKNGIEDLKKARHFIDKYIELLESDQTEEN